MTSPQRRTLPRNEHGYCQTAGCGHPFVNHGRSEPGCVRVGCPCESFTAPPMCPDGGSCHHRCAERCWRVTGAGPLSGAFPGDRWPDEIRQEHSTMTRMPTERLDEIRREATFFSVGSGTPRAAQERLMNEAVAIAFGVTPAQPDQPTEREIAVLTLMAVLGLAVQERPDDWQQFHDRFIAALTTLGVTGPEMRAAVIAMDRSGVPWRT